MEQICPLLFQPHQQILFMRQQPVQAAIEPVFPRHREIDVQQLVHRRAQEPLPMQAKLAARIDQSVYDQQLQHLVPTDCLAALLEALPPSLLQPQLMPKFASQPAVAESTRSPQLKPAEPDLQTGINNAIDTAAAQFVPTQTPPETPPAPLDPIQITLLAYEKLEDEKPSFARQEAQETRLCSLFQRTLSRLQQSRKNDEQQKIRNETNFDLTSLHRAI